MGVRRHSWVCLALLCLVGLFSHSDSVDVLQGTWTRLGEFGYDSAPQNLGAGGVWPAASSGAATFVFGENVFVCGGGDWWFNGRASSVNSPNAYTQCCMWNETKGQWSWCNSTAFEPTVAYSAAWADVSMNQLWVFGGKNWNSTNRSPSGPPPSGKLWRCNVTLGSATPLSSWEDMTSLQTGAIPLAVFGSSTWVDSQGRLWLTAGSSATSLTGGSQPTPNYNFVYRFDPSTLAWTQVKASGPMSFGPDGVESSTYAPLSTAWAGSAVDITKNVTWFFGGYGSNSDGGPPVALWRFNMTSGNWAKMNGDPNRRRSFSYFVERGVFHPENRPQPKASAKMVLDAEGRLWIMGGLTDCGFLSELWVYSPILNQWAIVGPGTGLWHSHQFLWPGVTSNPAMWPSVNKTSIYMFGGMGSEKWADIANSAKSSMWRLDISSSTQPSIAPTGSFLPEPGLTQRIYNNTCSNQDPPPQTFDVNCSPPTITNQTSGFLGNADLLFGSGLTAPVQWTGYIWNFEPSPKNVIITTSGEDRTQAALSNSLIYTAADAGAYNVSVQPWTVRGSTPFRKTVILQPGANKLDIFFRNSGGAGCIYTMISDIDFLTNVRPLSPDFVSITPNPPVFPPPASPPISPPILPPISTPVGAPSEPPASSPVASPSSSPRIETPAGSPLVPNIPPTSVPILEPVQPPTTTSSSPVAPPQNGSILITGGAPDSAGNSSSAGGAIAAGVIVGIISIAALIIFLLWWRRRKSRPSDPQTAEPSAMQDLAPINTKPPKNKARVSTSSSSEDNNDSATSHSNSANAATTYGPAPALEYDDAAVMQGTYTNNTNKGSSNKSKESLDFKPEWMIDFDLIEIGQKLGQGAFGVVYAGTYNYDDVAIKQCALNVGPDALDEFKSEAILLLSLKPHPSIVQVMGLSISGPNIYMIMEYCKKGSLDRYLGKHDLSAAQKIGIIDSIARGLVHLHQNNVVHRDLAARNILLGAGMKAKISDFGMSRIVDKFEAKGTTAAMIGPIRWMAPESLRKKEYSLKTDVWSFAIVVYEIWTGHPPWQDETDLLELAMRIRGDGVHPDLPEDAPQWLRDICLQCWARNPADRPSVADIAVAIRKGKQSMSDD